MTDSLSYCVSTMSADYIQTPFTLLVVARARHSAHCVLERQSSISGHSSTHTHTHTHTHVKAQEFIYYRQDLPQAALPVFRLLTGRFWGFSPRRAHSLHRSRSNLAGRSGRNVMFFTFYLFLKITLIGRRLLWCELSFFQKT